MYDDIGDHFSTLYPSYIIYIYIYIYILHIIINVQAKIVFILKIPLILLCLDLVGFYRNKLQYLVMGYALHNSQLRHGRVLKEIKVIQLVRCNRRP